MQLCFNEWALSRSSLYELRRRIQKTSEWSHSSSTTLLSLHRLVLKSLFPAHCEVVHKEITIYCSPDFSIEKNNIHLWPRLCARIALLDSITWLRQPIPLVSLPSFSPVPVQESASSFHSCVSLLPLFCTVLLPLETILVSPSPIHLHAVMKENKQSGGKRGQREMLAQPPVEKPGLASYSLDNTHVIKSNVCPKETATGQLHDSLWKTSQKVWPEC